MKRLLLFEIKKVSRTEMNIKKLSILMFVLVAGSGARAEPPSRTCEPIRIGLCDNVGYNVTGMPNLARHTLQSDAERTLQTFSPLLQYGCSSQLQLFLCAVYVPMCTEKVAKPIGPCRGLCEGVREACFPVLSGFGFVWPTELDCARFPLENNQETMCMEGPGQRDGAGFVGRPGAPRLDRGSLACRHLARAPAYVYLNRSRRCAQVCDADVLWDASERRLAEVWLTVWSGLCFLAALGALVTRFAAGSGALAARVDCPLISLALCHGLVAVGWGVRAAAGRMAVACMRDAQVPNLPLLNQDDLSNPNCTLVFIFVYYFGMAASVWWVILTAEWFSLVRSSAAGAKASGSGAAAGASSNGGAASSSNSRLKIVAWGLPAGQTVAILVLRDVNADELTGICFVGNQSSQLLLILVIIPQILSLVVGCILLLLGLRTLLATSVISHPSHAPPHRPAPHPQRSSIIRIGIFATLYIIPTSCILGSWLYEYLNKDLWLAAVKPSAVPTIAPKPAIWVFLLRILMLQILGVMTSVWILSSTASQAWNRLCSRMGPQTYKPAPVMCTAQTLPIHYYSSSTIQSSVPRTHSHSKYSTHSHAGHRKPRPHHAYPVPLPGGETVMLSCQSTQMVDL